MERAGAVALASEQAKAIEDAGDILAFVDVVFVHALGLVQTSATSIETFQKLLTSCLPWAHFKGNEADKVHRDEEKNYLIKWAKTAAQLKHGVEFAHALCKLRTDVHRFGDDKSNLIEAIVVSCAQVLSSEAASVLTKPTGIRNLMPYDAGVGIKEVLLSPLSSFWQPHEASKGLEVLSSAKQNPIIQKNALDFLDLIRKCANQGTYGMDASTVSTFFQHASLVVAIWDAAISTPLQYRRLSETRDTRRYLISKGIKAEMLATPDWLMVNGEKDKNEPISE